MAVKQVRMSDLSGRQVTAFDSYGKHMLTRFTDGWTPSVNVVTAGSTPASSRGRACARD